MTASPWLVTVRLRGALYGRRVIVDATRLGELDGQAFDTLDAITRGVDRMSECVLEGLSRDELYRMPLDRLSAVMQQVKLAIEDDARRRARAQ